MDVAWHSHNPKGRNLGHSAAPWRSGRRDVDSVVCCCVRRVWMSAARFQTSQCVVLCVLLCYMQHVGGQAIATLDRSCVVSAVYIRGGCVQPVSKPHNFGQRCARLIWVPFYHNHFQRNVSRPAIKQVESHLNTHTRSGTETTRLPPTDRQTDRQTQRQIDRQTDRYIHTHARTHAHTHKH
jgi:hypothetical protein